jgi:DNA-nicking Smr family endonuclease
MDPVSDTILASEAEAALEAAVERAYQRLAEEGFTGASRSEFSYLRSLLSRVKPLIKRGTTAYATYTAGREMLKSFNSARKSASSTMKSWRKRAADFGQWERRVKRKITRQLGRDYRTLTGKKKATAPKRQWRKTPAFPAKFGTRFRKSVKPRKSAKYVKRHYDDYGIITRDHALYAGFQKHGSQNRVCDIVAEALVRAIIASVHIYPRSYDEPVVEDFTGTEDMYETMTILWRRIDEQSGVSSEAQEEYSMKQTFEALSQAVGAHITAKLQDGYFPHEAFIYASDVGGTGNKRLAKRLTSLEDGRLEVIVKQTIRLQNLSPNDANTTALDVTGTNPIQGKIYEFSTQPLLQGQLEVAHANLARFQVHAQSETGVVYMDNGIAETGVDGILGHPPPAGDLFKNCRGVANVRIDAGHNKYKTTTYKFAGNLLAFAKRFTDMPYARHLGGGVVWFGFEQAFRSGIDEVKLGFNRELGMNARYSFARKPTMLKHYDQNDMGDLL